MRTWTVEGAEEKTGKSRKVMIKAQDEHEAEHVARLQGLLVSKVYLHVPSREPEPTIEELQRASEREVNRPSPSPLRKPPPTPLPIHGVVGRLNAADFLLSVLGAVCAIFGTIGVLMAAFIAAGHPIRDISAFDLGIASGVVVAYGVLMLGAGAAFRMLGMIGLATTKTAEKQ